MSYPVFDGFSLQDDHYIVSEMEYRTIPSRSLESEKISRRPGVKLLSDDFAERTIRLKGYILGDTASDLQSKIDDLHRNVTRKSSGSLVVDTNRLIEAVVSNIAIGDSHYNQSFVPFDLEFLCMSPFFLGEVYTIDLTVTSGTTSLPISTSISGTVFPEPTVIYYSPSGVGTTTTSGITFTYTQTGEILTWSGVSSPYLAYGDSVTFGWETQEVLQGITVTNPAGTFFRIQPGEANINVAFATQALGGTLRVQYQARYI